jgi:hypothetical protein
MVALGADWTRFGGPSAPARNSLIADRMRFSADFTSSGVPNVAMRWV